MLQVSELLQQHQLSDIKATDANGNTTLHLAMKNEKFTSKETIEILRILIDKGVDPKIKNKNNATVLHLAIENRERDVIDLLLTCNIQFDKSTTFYLFMSEYNKMLDLEDQPGMLDIEMRKMESESASFVEWIMSKGLNIDCLNRYEVTAVIYAMEMNLQHILPTLFKHIKDVNYVESGTGRTLLHLFLQKNDSLRQYCNTMPKRKVYSSYVGRYATTIVKILLDRGLSPEVADTNGNTALHLAIAKQESINIIEMLIKHSTNVNQKNVKGETVFHMVVYKWGWIEASETDDYMRISHALIAKGADVNEPGKDGTRPLLDAIESQNLRAVEFLLENGADFSVTTRDGETLLHLLVKESYRLEATDEVKIKLVDMLISKDCKINAKNANGNTPLHEAANVGDVVYVRRLIEHGAEIDARNNRKQTPLCYFATKLYSQKTDAAELLLEHGANVNAKNIEGFTVLHATAVGPRTDSNVQMLQLLLKHGADFNARTNAGHLVLRMGLWQDYNQDLYDFDKVKPQNLPSLAVFIEDYVSDEVELLLEHWIKLDVANLKCYIDHEYGDLIKKEKYKQYYEKCAKEIRTLKSTFIDSHTSLYTFLHMDLNSTRAYIYNETLQQLLQSPKLEQQFPEYSVLILAKYNEAVTRRSLLEPAKEAWLELTKISCLPEICIEFILSFLSNSDLFGIIGKE